MAVNTSFKEIQDNVLALLSKSDTATRNRVKNWINLGQQDFVLRELWPFREKTGSLATVAGTQEYSLASNFSDIDQQNIISVALQSPNNKKLPYWPFNQLRADQPDFDMVASAVPLRYYLQKGSIGFWPQPNAIYTVLIDYYSVPTEMSGDSDSPGMPIGYRESLIQYAISMEHNYNGDPDLAAAALNRYEQQITLARNNMLTQPNDTQAFRILGAQDARNWTGLSSEVR